MRHMIPCFCCSLCAVDLGVGFTGARAMLCTARGGEPVSMSDGCTLGQEGEPATAWHPAEPYLYGHEAVRGCE